MFLDTGVNSTTPADYKLQGFYFFFKFSNSNAETLFSAAEHPYATDVEWDPTGRYVVTYVSHWIRSNDNEYQVWSFLGRRLRKENKVCESTND